MDAQLLGWVLSTEGLYNDYLPQIKDSIRLTSLERLLIDRTQKFRQEKKHPPSWEELQLWHPEIPSKNGLPEEAIRDELTRLIRDEKLKSFIIKTANSIDKHSVNIIEIFSDAEKLKKELAFKETPEEPAIPINKFVKLPIPSVKYYANPLLQKEGRLIISGDYGICKTNFVLNLLIALATGKEFLGKFPLEQARPLYLDGEGGESVVKDRFIRMCGSEILKINSLFIKCTQPIDLLQSEWGCWLEEQIDKLKIEVLALDPVCNFWTGDENNKQDVCRLTSLLDGWIHKYKISIILVHHWRKPTREFRTGGVMASGSHKWMGWTDCHVTLEGSSTNSIIISCDKSRNSPKFPPFIVCLNPNSLWLEWVADYTKKFTEETLVALFEQADVNKTGRVAIANLIRLADGKPAKTTLHRLIDESTLFIKESAGERKRAYLIKKDIKSPNLFDSLSQRDNGTDSEIENE